jgi:hypothetical protein
MPLHQGQIRYLRETTSRKTRINVLVPANRWGKSTLIACLQIWYLFYKFGIPPGNRETWLKAEYRTANIAPHSALTEPVFKAINQILTSSFSMRLPDGRSVTNKCLIEWFYLTNRTQNSPPYKQFFINNSYIEHRSLGADQGDALQGKPYGIITYDEGGRSLHLQEEVTGNLLPRLGDWIGPFHILSTPDQNSPSILYHFEMYENGMNNINNTYTQEGSLKENQLFGKEQIEEQYKLFQDDPLGPQILEGRFIFGGDNLFAIPDIKESLDENLNDGVRREANHNYVIGIDTAIGSDEMVYTVLDCTAKPFRVVHQMAAKGNSKSPTKHLNDLLDLFDAYKDETTRVRIMLETWNGESVRFYQDLPPNIQILTKCYGSWQPERRATDNRNQPTRKTQMVKKADILMNLQKLLAAHELKLFKHDPNRPFKGGDLIQQLSIYKEKDDNIPTDRVFSLALACWMANETSTFQTAVKWL